MVSEPIRSVGNYVLGAQLGRGATSEVYAAEHRFLGDRAAVKLLRPELAGDGAAAQELVAEAGKLRAVRHPNVVRVLDAGSDPATGRCYLVMERVDGESLAARLERAPRLPEAEARRLGAAIADGLAAVHAAGLVHRDLKPANVMLDGEAPKLVDFGIAKALGGDTALATSRRVGTPAYMAPEQLVGGLIAPCVDVWALGVLLFEAVTGRLPFEGFEGGRCPQLVEVAPRAGALAAVSPAFERLIARCLERDPGRRPPSMEAVARALRGEGGALGAGDESGEPGGERITEDAGPLLGPGPLAPRAAVGHAALAPMAAAGGGLAAVAPRGAAGGGPAVVAPSSSRPATGTGAAAVALSSSRPVTAQASSRSAALPSPPGTAAGAPRWRRWLLVGIAGVIASLVGIGAAMLVIGSREVVAPVPVSSAPASAQRVVVSMQPESAASPPTPEPPEPGFAASPPAPAPPEPGFAASPPAPSPPPPPPAASPPVSAPAVTSAAPPAGAAAPRKPPRATLRVDVRSSPPGAQIFADGKLLGTTPRRLDLAAPATLTLRYQGYQPARVRAAGPGPIDVRLQRSCAHPPCEDLN